MQLFFPQVDLYRCHEALSSYCCNECHEINNLIFLILRVLILSRNHFNFLISWKINGRSIEQVIAFRYLGIYLQSSSHRINQAKHLLIKAPKAPLQLLNMHITSLCTTAIK